MPPAPTLPLELVLHSITLVDPEVDRATLVNCLRVSKACWETAARTLYCTMRIASATQFDKLFKAEDVDRERVRQCFSFVHRLEFGMWMPFDHETVPLLWSWAVPGQPLFPNVRQFLFHVKIYQGVPMNRTLPSDGIYIFDYLEDVCVYDHSDLCEPINHFLPSRDKRPLRSVTTHCELFISTTHYLWENAQRYHIYDCDNHREYQHDLWASYVMEADQGWKSRGEDSKLKLSLRARADEARELVQDFKSAGWSQTDDFQLEVGSTATTRPCELCGKSFRDWRGVREDPEDPEPIQWAFSANNAVAADPTPFVAWAPPALGKPEPFTGWAFCRDKPAITHNPFAGLSAPAKTDVSAAKVTLKGMEVDE